MLCGLAEGLTPAVDPQQAQSIHTNQAFDVYVKHLIGALGFTSEKAQTYVQSTSNDTHLKYPLTNICDYAMIDLWSSCCHSRH